MECDGEEADDNDEIKEEIEDHVVVYDLSNLTTALKHFIIHKNEIVFVYVVLDIEEESCKKRYHGGYEAEK